VGLSDLVQRKIAVGCVALVPVLHPEETEASLRRSKVAHLGKHLGSTWEATASNLRGTPWVEA